PLSVSTLFWQPVFLPVSPLWLSPRARRLSTLSSRFSLFCLSRLPSVSPGALVAPAVRTEGAGRRELAQLVADHRLRDEDRHVFFAVVDGDRVADHLREDRRGARPGFGHLFFAGLVLGVDASHQTLLDPRALFGRTTHGLPPALLLAATTAADDVTIGL